MPETVVNAGDPEVLRFRLEWSGPSSGVGAADATRGRLLAWVGGTLVWGRRNGAQVEGLDWAWVELLEWLSTAWPYLEWEERGPLGLPPAEPTAALADVERHWQQTPEARREREEEELWSFRDTHDLSRGVNGTWVAPLWVMRQGRRAWVSALDVRLDLPAPAVLDALQGLGEGIATRLRGIADERAKLAVAAWQQRHAVPKDRFVALTTGLEPAVVSLLQGSHTPEEAWELSGTSFEPTELLAVARMFGRGADGTILRSVLSRVRTLGAHRLERLDELASSALALLGDTHGKPFDQGQTLGAWLREQLGRGPEQPVDPELILREWGVTIRNLRLTDTSVDAIAVWGPKHGPAVFVNELGQHAKGIPGRRATLAHELAHLLLDREGALPLAEVLGGAAPRAAEARANAFAAELLLPKSIAGPALAATKDPKNEVRRLRSRYGASAEVVAWQARNSPHELPAKTLSYLRGLVGEPHKF